eukprot:scaffold23479_cov143-Cylindrotheca_fusiformis.AAC.25
MMVAEMSYSTVSSVIDTWEQVRRVPNYSRVIGTLLFQKFFAMEPGAKRVFGFREDMDMHSEDVVKSRRFIKHATFFVQMIDRSLDMLGPDVDMLTEILLELGEKHVRYGVKPEYFSPMGTALIDSIAVTIGEDKFPSNVRADWVEVYGALSYDMIRGQSRVAR